MNSCARGSATAIAGSASPRCLGVFTQAPLGSLRAPPAAGYWKLIVELQIVATEKKLLGPTQSSVPPASLLTDTGLLLRVLGCVVMMTPAARRDELRETQTARVVAERQEEVVNTLGLETVELLPPPAYRHALEALPALPGFKSSR